LEVGRADVPANIVKSGHVVGTRIFFRFAANIVSRVETVARYCRLAFQYFILVWFI